MTKHLRNFLMAALVVIMTIAAGCSGETANSTAVTKDSGAKATMSAEATTQEAANNPMSKMVVYVPTDDGRGVRPQSVTLDSNKKTVKYALSVIFEEDARQKYPVFAKGTAVKGVTVKDGIATVNMNKAFVANDNGGELTAQLRLAAIVNTVTEFKDVKGVLFRIDGKPLTSFGAYDLSDPLSRMDNLIVK